LFECVQRRLEPPVLGDRRPAGVETLAKLGEDAVQEVRHASACLRCHH
jgi:hypothetical protein